MYAPPFSFEVPGECTRDRGTNLAACPRARHNLFHLIVVKPLEAEPYQLNRSCGNSPLYTRRESTPAKPRECFLFLRPAPFLSTAPATTFSDWFSRLPPRMLDLLVRDYSNSSPPAINLSADFCALINKLTRSFSFSTVLSMICESDMHMIDKLLQYVIFIKLL